MPIIVSASAFHESAIAGEREITPKPLTLSVFIPRPSVPVLPVAVIENSEPRVVVALETVTAVTLFALALITSSSDEKPSV